LAVNSDTGITVDVDKKIVTFASPDKFLSFFNDDYVRSELSSGKYLASIKKPR
jgi:hypothetical protein